MSPFPRKLLMTVDAVGGVWRYAMDLAGGLSARGTEVVFVGFGPEPSADQAAEAARLGKLRWLPHPLDWMAREEGELGPIAPALRRIALGEGADLIHLNLPSQAAGLDPGCPIVAVSHSCVATWFRAVRGAGCPPGWAWQERLNHQGLATADAAVAPSRSHAGALAECYGAIPHLSVVHNASAPRPQARGPKRPFVLAAGRWWDEGKNGAVFDAAARATAWPVRMAGPTRGPNGEGLAIANAESLGSLPFGAVAALMAEAAVFCSPSLYEPFGLAALEAAGAGAAMVLADIPTYRELWEGAALFADPRRPEAFAAALNRLAGDEALRRALAARAGFRARKFSPAAQAEATLSLYAAVRRHGAERRAG